MVWIVSSWPCVNSCFLRGGSWMPRRFSSRFAMSRRDMWSKRGLIGWRCSRPGYAYFRLSVYVFVMGWWRWSLSMVTEVVVVLGIVWGSCFWSSLWKSSHWMGMVSPDSMRISESAFWLCSVWDSSLQSYVVMSRVDSGIVARVRMRMFEPAFGVR